MKKIAIFASGNGSNAQKIAEYFKDTPQGEVTLVLCNNPNAYVLQRAQKLGIETFIFDKKELNNSRTVLNKLKESNIDFVVLAGFLLLVPDYLVDAYPHRIINIHPALLPKHSGKGMYGTKVHQSVKDSQDKHTGISIHYVNGRYDEGEMIFQATCPVTMEDTPETIAEKVHVLEYKHYPRIIASVIKNFGPEPLS